MLVELLSLRLGLLNRFFYGAMHSDVQGIDYFSLPKAYLNLVAGHSAYATFDPPAYGPHFTWYLAHPALAVGLGSWLSAFAPMTSYGIFVMLSLAVMAAAAWVLARLTDDKLTRALIWLLLLGAFPSYWMLFVGNVQSLLVLALALVFAGMWRMGRAGDGEWLLFSGLILSLLTKPVVLLLLPLLLLLRETRRPAWRVLAVYLGVSLVFELTPFFNPESIGLGQVAWLVAHPAFVGEQMNIYSNHFDVTPMMRDNSIHWLNLIAQSGTRMMHVDIFSLPVFVDTLLGQRTPNWLWQLPTLAALALQGLVARMPASDAAGKSRRMEAAVFALMTASLAFFLGYPTVWEYQYTSVLPIAAVLLLTPSSLRPRWRRAMFALAACAWLPSLYIFTEGHPLTTVALTLIRLDRVVPVTLLFVLFFAETVRLALTRAEHPS